MKPTCHPFDTGLACMFDLCGPISTLSRHEFSQQTAAGHWMYFIQDVRGIWWSYKYDTLPAELQGQAFEYGRSA